MWDGEAAAEAERVSLWVERGDASLLLRVDAPDHGDPPPSAPAGSTPGLWNFEVVELFLLGRDERYLEVELGPHGHHLVIELRGRRRPVATRSELVFATQREGGRWQGEARIPLGWLPPDMDRANAYAIHGEGSARRCLAWQPVPGDSPDFHRLDRFAPLCLPQSD